MRSIWLLTLVLAFGIGCKGDPDPNRYGRQLTGAEIQTLFAAKTVEGHHDVHGYDFKSYYEPSGVYRSHQSDKKAPRPAKWWVNGDDICIRWDDTPGDLCRRMFVDKAGVYRKVLVESGKRKVVVTFKSFKPGNPENL